MKKHKLLPILFLLMAGCLPQQSLPQDEEPFLPVSGSPPMFFKRMETKPIAKDKEQPPTNPRPTFRLVSADREALYRSFFPKTDDPKTNALKDQVSFYDEESIPRVYQVWDLGEQRSGLVRTDAGQRSANNEFPWATPAGTVAGDNHKTIRFVKLEQPIQWRREFAQQGNKVFFNGIAWEYPTGTVFGEILLVTDPAGIDHTAELRTRRKNSEGDWTTNAFRPFPKEKGFRDALLERGFDFLPTGPIPERINSGQQNRPFIATANVERLPNMSSSLVASLLDGSTFESARHKKWTEIADGPTAQGFSIVPDKFIGGFIPVNGESCARCHEDAGKVVNLVGDTRWRLRGSDRIFTFHPFAQDSIGRDMRFNQTLVEAGLLVHKPGAP